MMNYKVVADTSYIQFEALVESALKDGFKLVGGVSVTHSPNGLVFAQALAK